MLPSIVAQLGWSSTFASLCSLPETSGGSFAFPSLCCPSELLPWAQSFNRSSSSGKSMLAGVSKPSPGCPSPEGSGIGVGTSSNALASQTSTVCSTESKCSFMSSRSGCALGKSSIGFTNCSLEAFSCNAADSSPLTISTRPASFEPSGGSFALLSVVVRFCSLPTSAGVCSCSSLLAPNRMFFLACLPGRLLTGLPEVLL
mmetsp:Transcript_105961/g.194328  ORF Transcript_105961/g.194328 Transcript_105961/m.194328 type:complete len:201 (+) Transcript_105961:318-920(+)